MQLTLIQTRTSPVIEEFLEKMNSLNLLYYASYAADEMEFESEEELHESVKRAMKLCMSAGIPIKGNFQRIYKCSVGEIRYDWKLSELAYKLVCLSGSADNPCVARTTIKLIKQAHINNI